MTNSPELDSWASLAVTPSIAVVGLGGAGSEAVADLLALGIPGVRAFAVNTDANHLLRTGVEERILLGHRELRGRGSGGDREAVLRGAEEGKEELLRRLRPFEIVFLLAGLGGGTGSALLPFLSRELRETDTLPIPVAFLPFQVELDTNTGRRENVEATVADLEGMGGFLLALANEKLRRFDSLPIHRVFQVRNAYVHSLVTSLVDMVENPSQISVDFASLKNHLRASDLSTLVVGEYHISEPERLVQEALNETLLDYRIAERPSVLVHLDGGSNMTLGTLDRVLRALRHRLGEPERLVLGTRSRSEPSEVGTPHGGGRWAPPPDGPGSSSLERAGSAGRALGRSPGAAAASRASSAAWTRSITWEVRRLRGPTETWGTPESRSWAASASLGSYGSETTAAIDPSEGDHSAIGRPPSVSQTAPGSRRNSARAAGGSTGPTRRPGDDSSG